MVKAFKKWRKEHNVTHCQDCGKELTVEKHHFHCNQCWKLKKDFEHIARKNIFKDVW